MAGADLIPNEAIHELAARVNSPEFLGVLQRIQHANFIWNNHSIAPDIGAILQQLGELGLIDAAYQSERDVEPAMWVSNDNGSRVLKYLTGIRAGPHYEISSTELAAWLEENGEDRWWNVDGDPLLTGRLSFPCPADELVAALLKIDRALLVRAKKNDNAAKGQLIGKAKLDQLVERIATEGQLPDHYNLQSGDRVVYLCWKGLPREWLLVEDCQTTAQVKAEQMPQAK